MKGKKGKKSLVDLDNFRSTRLKELVRLLPSSNFGTSSTSIRTTSDLPPSYSRTNDSILICNTVGRYNEFIKTDGWSELPYSKYDNGNLIYIGGGIQNDNVDDVGGWYYYNNPNDGYTNFYGTIFGSVQGYLFLFFGTKSRYRGVCTQCYKDSEVIGECETFDTNQGKMFAVFISNISQINALNRTMAVNSDGIFLSTNINKALDANNQTIKSVIDDLKRYDNYTTQIISPILLNNPIEIVANYIEYINFKNVIVPGDDYFREYAVIPLKNFITSTIFKDENMGSGIFTVNKNSSIIFESLDPWSAQFNVTTPKINSTNINNTGVLELPIDDSVNIYITKQKFGFPLPRLLTFSVLFTQPSYELTQNTFYLPKTLSLKFMVNF
jgi:hypothetical protein